MEIVFIKPTRIEDCAKCLPEIKGNKILHINLCAVEYDKAERIMDYISGAIFMQEGQIVNPAENIYCTIPKGTQFSTLATTDEETEIILEK
ncbi:MAG: cell division protein SepF [Fusobacteriaceae bacterium]|jgi:cell division inhibitor SepF|nr:cell division protein SepF [Fusobacteriaceae bacterium]